MRNSRARRALARKLIRQKLANEKVTVPEAGTPRQEDAERTKPALQRAASE